MGADEADTGLQPTSSVTDALAAAAATVLTGRDLAILELRLGLSGDEPQTLESIAQQFGITRERVRQLVGRNVRRLRYRGRDQLRAGHDATPCAHLLRLVDDLMGLGEDASVERLVASTPDEPLEVQSALLSLAVGPREAKELSAVLTRLRRDRRAAIRRQPRGERRYPAMERLLAAIEWPPTVAHLDSLPVISRMREPRSDSPTSHAGSFFSQKLHREVLYESMTERKFYQGLERWPAIRLYQEQPVVVPYLWEGLERSYYPDTFVWLADGRGVVVEVKPAHQFALHLNAVKWHALRQFCRERGYGLLITDGRIGIQTLMQHPVPEAFRQAFHQALAHGPVQWPECRRLREAHDATLIDFVALVLQDRLIWRLGPFEVVKPLLA